MKILTIVGPTAVGKTKVAIEIARRISGEIISADSRQIYKYLNIGTAKPTRKERKKINIHLIDFIHPDNTYSCGKFARDAEAKIEQIIRKGNIPIICGGTGLYIRSLFNPLHKLPESDKKNKEKLICMLAEHGLDYLYEKLLSVDPEWAKKINPRDKQRILRGLEVYAMTGKPLSTLIKKKKRKSKYLPYYIGLNLPREELYQRINNRFDDMLNNGLIEEVKSLLKKGFNPESSALRTIGYKEIIEYLQGELSREAAIEKVKCRTRNFAKRQITWFNKITGLQWYSPEDPDIVKNIISRWGKLHHI